MLSRLRSHLTYANVMSSVAVFLALGGTSAYAINEWTGANIKNETLTGADVKGKAATSSTPLVEGTITGQDIRGSAGVNGSVFGQDIANNSVTGKDVNESSLGKVPNADKLDGRDSTAFLRSGAAAGGDLAGSYPNPTIRTPETMHYVGTSGEVGFNGGWDNLGAGWAPVSFYKDHEGVVHLRGLLRTPSTGSSGQVFFLPEGYKPCDTPGPHGGELLFPSHSGDPGQAARIDISYYGTVSASNYATNSHLTLNGISFPTENC